jgi:glucokinase
LPGFFFIPVFISPYLDHLNFFMAVIALDLGGTKLAAAIISDEGAMLFSDTIFLEGRGGSEAGSLILQQANKFLTKAKTENIPITALGICVPGIVHAKTGTVWAPNISGWDDYPLRSELQNNIIDATIAIKMDSDRACYILAETWKGNAHGCRDAIFLSVGTGIGAGILVNGQVLRGAHDVAGAIGWLALDKPFEKKYAACGCFEYQASGEGLGKVAAEMIAGKIITNSKLANAKKVIVAMDIFDAYEVNDPLAVLVINNAIEYWGMAVANLVSLFNPEKIIFGGGVFGPALKFLDDIYEASKKWAQPVSINQVRLEGTALGADAGLFGAGYLALLD